MGERSGEMYWRSGIRGLRGGRCGRGRPTYGCECPEQSIAGDSGFYLCVYVDDYIVPTICHAWNFRERMRSSCLQRSIVSFSCFRMLYPYGLAPVGESFILIGLLSDPTVTRRQLRAKRFKVSSFYLAEMGFLRETSCLYVQCLLAHSYDSE